MDKEIMILMVDDEADHRRLMTFWLKSKGYSVTEVGDGESAIQLIKDDAPDIVLLDTRMPIMSGVEVLKKIREFNKNLPVIMLSAHADGPETDEIKSCGVSGFFFKGKSFDEILPLLESVM